MKLKNNISRVKQAYLLNSGLKLMSFFQDNSGLQHLSVLYFITVHVVISIY